MSFPLSDWQFWIVTLGVLFAAAWLLRAIVPVPWLSARAKRKRGLTRATLTIGGERVEKK